MLAAAIPLVSLPQSSRAFGEILARGYAMVFPQPAGLWLLHSDGSGLLYGATGPSANWTLAQWDIPRDLPGFENNVSENEFARVQYLGAQGYTLHQFGGTFPCEMTYQSGRRLVGEFDLFVESGRPNHAGHRITQTEMKRPLSDIHHLLLSLSVRPVSVSVINDSCRVTQGSLLAAVIFRNPSKRQTFNYQLRLAVFRSQAGALVNRAPPPGWFFKGLNRQTGQTGKYGFDDNPASLGQPDAREGISTDYAVDLLPRIKQIIRNGTESGLDPDMSDWLVGDTYHGSNIWGHIMMASHWQDFSLAAN